MSLYGRLPLASSERVRVLIVLSFVAAPIFNTCQWRFNRSPVLFSVAFVNLAIESKSRDTIV